MTELGASYWCQIGDVGAHILWRHPLEWVNCGLQSVCTVLAAVWGGCECLYFPPPGVNGVCVFASKLKAGVASE